MEEVKKYPLDFGILLLGLGVFGWLFLKNAYLPLSQKTIAFVGGIFYFLWGAVHHCLRGDLCLRVLLEYFLFSLFVTGAVLLVLNWV